MLFGRLAIAKSRKSRPKPLFNDLSVFSCERVLGQKIAAGPGGCLIGRIDARQISEEAVSKYCRLLG